MAFWSLSPCWLKPCRVKPYRKLFTQFRPIAQLWLANTPQGCAHKLGAGVSGNAGSIVCGVLGCRILEGLNGNWVCMHYVPGIVELRSGKCEGLRRLACIRGGRWNRLGATLGVHDELTLPQYGERHQGRNRGTTRVAPRLIAIKDRKST